MSAKLDIKEKKNKTYIQDIDSNIYDIKNKDDYEKIKGTLNEDLIRQISKEKEEPSWMLDIRLECLETFYELELPKWGPDLSEIDLENIAMYVKTKNKMAEKWEDVPEDIRDTFEKLGIPEAEKENLAGVGAQYDSEVVYHSVKKELEEKGIIYLDFETAVKKYPEIIKKYFMKLIMPKTHKFAALHGAVWSGGSFVFVPKDVCLDMPIQSYFRANSEGAGQFEHTLIILEKNSKIHFIEGCSAPKYNKINIHAGAVEVFVAEGAQIRYSTIENWSKNMMNLNTKKALLEKNSKIEWVSGSFGSKVSMLYPMSILNGEYAKSEFTGIAFANEGQNLDTGAKVVHNAPNTYSTINSRSICKNGGITTYRGLVKFGKNSNGSKSNVSCESLMLDNESVADTIPMMEINNDKVDIGHEAKIGKISDKAIFYLMTRGLSEEKAKAMIVRGFAEPIAKELPGEYAVEMNNLINIELEGVIG